VFRDAICHAFRNAGILIAFVSIAGFSYGYELIFLISFILFMASTFAVSPLPILPFKIRVSRLSLLFNLGIPLCSRIEFYDFTFPVWAGAATNWYAWGSVLWLVRTRTAVRWFNANTFRAVLYIRRLTAVVVISFAFLARGSKIFVLVLVFFVRHTPSFVTRARARTIIFST
jgi:hypothetical protein